MRSGRDGGGGGGSGCSVSVGVDDDGLLDETRDTDEPIGTETLKNTDLTHAPYELGLVCTCKWQQLKKEALLTSQATDVGAQAAQDETSD